jgi:hypothetical protein
MDEQSCQCRSGPALAPKLDIQCKHTRTCIVYCAVAKKDCGHFITAAVQDRSVPGLTLMTSSLLPAGTFSSLKGVLRSTGFLLYCRVHCDGTRAGLNLLAAACRVSERVCMGGTLTTCFCSAGGGGGSKVGGLKILEHNNRFKFAKVLSMTGCSSPGGPKYDKVMLQAMLIQGEVGQNPQPLRQQEQPTGTN